MNIKTFDDVLSDDLLELVQIELNLFMYVKHTSTEGADNYFLLQTQVITLLMIFY